MQVNDVADILQIPRQGTSGEGSSKKQKEKEKKPGMRHLTRFGQLGVNKTRVGDLACDFLTRCLSTTPINIAIANLDFV
jgi:hypothetical protein